MASTREQETGGVGLLWVVALHVLYWQMVAAVKGGTGSGPASLTSRGRAVPSSPPVLSLTGKASVTVFAADQERGKVECPESTLQTHPKGDSLPVPD